MKKRLVTLMAAMVLTLSMGMTAFAADSPIVDDTQDFDVIDGATTVIDGQTVDLEFDYYLLDTTEAEEAEIEKYLGETDKEALQTKLKELVEKTAGVTYSGYDYFDWFGISLPEGVTMPQGGIDVTFDASYVHAGDYVVVLHLKADGTWENVPCKVENGKIVCKFTSLSPVFVMVLRDAKALNTSATTTTNAATTTKAPKTGEFAGIYVAGMFALISVAGIVVYTKRQKTVR